jgi:hypothetical protein
LSTLTAKPEIVKAADTDEETKEFNVAVTSTVCTPIKAYLSVQTEIRPDVTTINNSLLVRVGTSLGGELATENVIGPQ